MPHKRPRLKRLVRVHWRLLLRRLERAAPFVLAWVPSWGTSLLLHGLAILLLALYLYVRSGAKPIEGRFETAILRPIGPDLTSLYDSDHAGDPFTEMKSPEPPSLSVEVPDPSLDVISQPEIPKLARFAPDLAGPEGPPDLGPSLGTLDDPDPARKGKGTAKVASFRVHAENVTAPFSGRSGTTKSTLLRREGGTVRSEKAVEDGLDWLARHQRPDGSWSLNFHEQCQGSGCPAQPSMESDTAATGLALLPLLGGGHIHTKKSRYQVNVRKALEWLVDHQDTTGDLFVGGAPMGYLYSHAIGTMALCEAYGISGDPALRRPAERAVRFISQAQDVDGGGWRYRPGQPGDTSVFGWQMFALRSARLAGIAVPKNVVRGCRSFLDSVAADAKVTYAYMPGRPITPVMTAEALLARQYLGWPRDYPPLVKGARHIAMDLEESQERNIYYWYYATQLLHNMQNDDWKSWNVRVREGLIAMQVQGGNCDRGSWDPFQPQPDRWGIAAGRLFLTSLSLLTLEVYYRWLPLYQPSDADPLRGKDDGVAADRKPPAEPPKGSIQPPKAEP